MAMPQPAVYAQLGQNSPASSAAWYPPSNTTVYPSMASAPQHKRWYDSDPTWYDNETYYLFGDEWYDGDEWHVYYDCGSLEIFFDELGDDQGTDYDSCLPVLESRD